MFRATAFSIGSRAIQYSQMHNATLLQYQEQISSGLRLQRSSDDPISFRQVTSLRSRMSELAADQRSISTTKSILSTSTVNVQEYADLINRAKSLALQGVQALDETERNAIALEVDGLLSSLKNIASTQFDGNYVFAGRKADVRPFDFNAPQIAGRSLEVAYSGSDRNSRAFVGESVSIDTFYDGQYVFSAPDRGSTVLLGPSGAVAGSGTDSMTGRATLSVIHRATTYSGASGIQPGTGSAGNDTVIGNAGKHAVHIDDESGDGSWGWITLNNGAPVRYTNTDDNLEVKGASGESVFVDTTSMTAGYNGVIDVVASGDLSVDGGTTTVAIDFSTNQVVTDPSTGGFVNVDSTSIRLAADNYLEFPGTADAFQVLFELSEDLKNTRGLGSNQYAESLNRRVGELERMSDHAFHVLGEQSTSLRTLEVLGLRIDELELSVETQLSEIQSTDIPEAVLRMENSRQLLEYTYAATATISSIGLLNFLR
ncbi:MAG: flagellar hook-associated protein FlgL [Planctomycetota bacterium]